MELLSVKGIIPRLMGGLGNQIFIVIAAYIASKNKNCPLYILDNPVSNNAHNINNLNYKESIFKYFGDHVNITQNEQFNYFLICHGYNFHSPSSNQDNHAFLAWDPAQVRPGSIMSSYYQYYPTIKPYEEEIRNIILKGLNEYKNLPIIGKKSNTAFLHIRRGDYLKHPDIHYNQPLEYYKNALLELILRNRNITEIKVFSDDIEWVKSKNYFQTSLFTIIEEKDEIKTLYMMAQCEAGAICANSTFSWWGAFLGAYSKRNPVIIPKKWISSEVVSLFPDEWISM
jgi:hypothetical protein